MSLNRRKTIRRTCRKALGQIRENDVTAEELIKNGIDVVQAQNLH